MFKIEKIPTEIEITVSSRKLRRKIERLASLSKSVILVKERIKNEFKEISDTCEFMKLSDEIIGFDKGAFRSCQHSNHMNCDKIIHKCSLFNCPLVQ